MHWATIGVLAGLLLGGSTLPPAPRGQPPSTQVPTERCSAQGQGTSVIRVRLLSPAGRQLTVPANVVIVSLHCGAPVGPGGLAELVAVPAGSHILRIAALGCSPDSIRVSTGNADTVLTEVHLRACYRVSHDSGTSSPSPR